MASSFLCPPNTHSLSDNVIGGVVQGVGSLHGRYGFANDHDSRVASRYMQPRQMNSPDQVDSYSTAGAGAYSMMNKVPSQSLVGRKRLPDLNSLAELATKRTKEVPQYTTEEPQTTLPTKERKMKVSASRRERCRINQARYRKRQREHEEELEKGIQLVQENIQELETQRQNIMRCAPTNESVWVVATEYFRLFRYGYMMPMVTPESSSAGNNDKQNACPAMQAHVQLDYLRATMTPDVTDGHVSGVEALLGHWKQLSLYHDDVHLQLKRLEQLGEDSLLAVTETSVTVTENTLRNVYPHLVEENGGEEFKPLAAKLLSRRSVLCGSVRFDWDSSCGRVMRVESTLDVLTPMLKLLGSLENVVKVFEKSAMSLDGRISTKKSESSTGSSN